MSDLENLQMEQQQKSMRDAVRDGINIAIDSLLELGLTLEQTEEYLMHYENVHAMDCIKELISARKNGTRIDTKPPFSFSADDMEKGLDKAASDGLSLGYYCAIFTLIYAAKDSGYENERIDKKIAEKFLIRPF